MLSDNFFFLYCCHNILCYCSKDCYHFQHLSYNPKFYTSECKYFFAAYLWTYPQHMILVKNNKQNLLITMKFWSYTFFNYSEFYNIVCFPSTTLFIFLTTSLLHSNFLSSIRHKDRKETHCKHERTSPSQKSMSLTPALYVCCLLASFSFSLFSADLLTRSSHCPRRLSRRFCTASSEPAHCRLSMRSADKKHTVKQTIWSYYKQKWFKTHTLYWSRFLKWRLYWKLWLKNLLQMTATYYSYLIIHENVYFSLRKNF